MIEINWRIIPQNTPTVRRNCSRCETQRSFVSTYRFRVNAQQKNLDVWLIWQCEHCGCTWNMELFSRIKAGVLKDELYQGFLENNTELAQKYAYDVGMLSKNNADVCYDDIQYTVEGQTITPGMLKINPLTLHIFSEYDLHLRLDKMLGEQTGLSRTVLKRWLESGAISCNGFGARSGNGIRIKGDILVRFDPALM